MCQLFRCFSHANVTRRQHDLISYSVGSAFLVKPGHRFLCFLPGALAQLNRIAQLSRFYSCHFTLSIFCRRLAWGSHGKLRVLSLIVRIFGTRQQVDPIITSEIALIHSLGLTIGLRVKRSRQAPLYYYVVAQRSPIF